MAFIKYFQKKIFFYCLRIIYSLCTVCVNPGARLGLQVGKAALACMVPDPETQRGPTGNERAQHDRRLLHASPEKRRETRVQKKKAEQIDHDTV